jgi:hypothetical protein
MKQEHNAKIPLTVDYEGKTYPGTCWHRDGMLTVYSTEFGQKSIEAGPMPTLHLARTLLRQMVKESR